MQVRFFLIGLLVVFSVGPVLSQVTADSLTREEDPTLDLLSDLDKKKKAPKEKKEIKQPKNVFFGIKARKGFVKTGAGDRQTLELFYYLPDYSVPNQYIPHVVWFQTRKKELQTVGQIDKETHRLLHGPYKKFVAGKLVEEGSFYMGTRHGRWEKYDANYTLLDKLRYHKGWLEDAKITYYDANQTKVKEVTPVQYGLKHGEYYQFYEGGQLAVKGQYEYDRPVGKWMEYYQFRRRYKKETQYPTDPFDKTTEPYTLREWDDKGNLTFERAKEDKKTLSKY